MPAGRGDGGASKNAMTSVIRRCQKSSQASFQADPFSPCATQEGPLSKASPQERVMGVRRRRYLKSVSLQGLKLGNGGLARQEHELTANREVSSHPTCVALSGVLWSAL